MKNLKGFVWLPVLLALLGLLLVGDGYYLYTTNHHPVSTAPIQTAVATTTPQTQASSIQTPAQTKIYTNTQYGFSLKYPSGLELDTDAAQLTDSGDSQTVLAEIKLSGQNNIVLGTWNVTAGSSTYFDCLHIPNSSDSPAYSDMIFSDIATTTINGVDFQSYAYQTTLSGYFDYGTVYKTLHNGTCFIVSLDASAGTDGSVESSQVALAQADRQQIVKTLAPILQSFQFTTVQSQTITTSNDFSFTVPAGWTTRDQLGNDGISYIYLSDPTTKDFAVVSCPYNPHGEFSETTFIASSSRSFVSDGDSYSANYEILGSDLLNSGGPIVFSAHIDPAERNEQNYNDANLAARSCWIEAEASGSSINATLSGSQIAGLETVYSSWK